MPVENSPDPEEVQDQMRSAIERIRAKLTEPQASQQPDDLWPPQIKPTQILEFEGR
jgi:hypothetical protein